MDVAVADEAAARLAAGLLAAVAELHLLQVLQVPLAALEGADLLAPCALLRECGEHARHGAVRKVGVLHLVRELLDLLKVQAPRVEQCLEERLLPAHPLQQLRLRPQHRTHPRLLRVERL